MKVYTEKDAEDFLKRNGFNVSRLLFAKNLQDLEKNKKKLSYPLVVKIVSKKIVHKHEVKGFYLNIYKYEDVIKAFNKLKKIKSFEGVLIQKQFNGYEFLLGLKKTPEFGHVIALSFGKSLQEKEKNISFRVCPITKKDAYNLVNEVVGGIKINKKPLIKTLIKLSRLSLKYPKINELDINPLYIDKNLPQIVDAQIVFE